MAESKGISNRGSSKRKKKSTRERLIARFNNEEFSEEEEEPPFKKQKIEYYGNQKPPSKNSDHLLNLITDCRDPVVSTPSKSSECEPSLPLSTIKSPDSAYNSCTDKSPFTLLRLPSSVGNSSGIGTDVSDCLTPYVNDVKDQQHHSSNEDLKSDNVFKFLHREFAMLKEEMDPSGIADRLFADGIIDRINREDMSEERGRAKKVDCLIKAIARSPHVRKPSTERKLRMAFEAEKCLFLLDNLGKDYENPSASYVKTFGKMEVSSKLHLHSKEIDDVLEPKHIIDDLVSLGMLNLLEHDDILTNVLKKTRILCLMDYLMKDSEENFPMFCEAVNKKYPELGKKLMQKDFSKDPSDVNQPKTELQVKVKVQSTKLPAIPRDIGNRNGMTFIKFNIRDEEDLEHMIVDDHNRDPSPGLTEEAMELGFTEDGLQFKCIKINLTELSRLSQLRLYRKCKESPQFLESWLRSILPKDKLKEMQARKITSLQFEIYIEKPSKEMCSCKLKKEHIVKEFSLIEKSMKKIDDIVRVFAEFPNFKAETRSIFNEMMLTDVRKVETFLLKILDAEYAAVCLLQQELINTDQTSLLEAMTTAKQAMDCKARKVHVKSFRKCFSFLQEELEPRKFIGALVQLPGNEETSEYVMSSEPRRKRCQKFLEFIYREGQMAVDHFVLLLEAEKKGNILDVLTSVDNKEQNNEKDVESLRDSILEKFDMIASEVDTRLLRHIFIERKVMKAKEFDTVCKHPHRKTRIVGLLKEILNRDGVTLSCFMHALEIGGYEKLAGEIIKEKESYKPCPRLDMAKVVVFKGTCELAFSTESEQESPLQLELHKRIYGNDRIDKDLYTRRWLEQISPEPLMPIGQKRRHSDIGQDDEKTLAKRLLTELDKDSGIDSSSNVTESTCKRNDEASDKYSQSQDDLSSQILSSLPTSPSTSITLYEQISPPTSPMSEPSTISFRPDNNYYTAVTAGGIKGNISKNDTLNGIGQSSSSMESPPSNQGQVCIHSWENLEPSISGLSKQDCVFNPFIQSDLQRVFNSRSRSLTCPSIKRSKFKAPPNLNKTY